MADLQAGERAARVRVGVRRALAGQVRQERQTLRARAPTSRPRPSARRTRRRRRSRSQAQRARRRRASRPSGARRRARRGRRRARAPAGRRGTRAARRRRRRTCPSRRSAAPAGRRRRRARPRPGRPRRPRRRRRPRVRPETSGDSSTVGSHAGSISSVVEHLVAPAPLRDVEQQRARGVGDVDRALAGQLQPHVVLGQHHVRDARVVVRLVLAQPQQLRRGEAGQRAVAGQLDEPVEADALLDLRALGGGALVVPEDRRAGSAGRWRRA